MNNNYQIHKLQYKAFIKHLFRNENFADVLNWDQY